jgi:Zn-dependent protease with chaperone function
MFQADYYDANSSAKRAVTAVVRGDELCITGVDVDLRLRTTAVNLQPRIGDVPPRIELPDGGVLVCRADYRAVADALNVRSAKTLAHRLESNLWVVFGSLAGVIVAGWFAYAHGIPWLASTVAERMPVAIERDLGRATLAWLDSNAFSPSKLDAAQKEEIRKGHAELLAQSPLPKDLRLEFRAGGWIGANALAIPGQIVVVTDELVEVVGSTDRVLAVLAHELGHVEHRHGLRNVLQSSLTGLLALVVWGDASAVASVAATVPTALVHAGYSREAEREADQYAFDLLKRTGRSPALFAEAMEALDAHYTQLAGGERGRGSGYLSTHPDPSQRAKEAREAALKP